MSDEWMIILKGDKLNRFKTALGNVTSESFRLLLLGAFIMLDIGFIRESNKRIFGLDKEGWHKAREFWKTASEEEKEKAKEWLKDNALIREGTPAQRAEAESSLGGDYRFS